MNPEATTLANIRQLKPQYHNVFDLYYPSINSDTELFLSPVNQTSEAAVAAHNNSHRGLRAHSSLLAALIVNVTYF